MPRLVVYGWLDQMPAAQQGPPHSPKAATEERVPFLAVQRIPGCRLVHAVEARGLRSLDELRPIAVSAARMLAAVHALGVAHMSAHERNLLLGPPPGNQVRAQAHHACTPSVPTHTVSRRLC